MTPAPDPAPAPEPDQAPEPDEAANAAERVASEQARSAPASAVPASAGPRSAASRSTARAAGSSVGPDQVRAARSTARSAGGTEEPTGEPGTGVLAAEAPDGTDELVGEALAVVGRILARNRRPPLWSRLLVGFGVAMMLLATGGIVGVKVLTSRYEHAVHRAVLLAPEVRVEPTPGPISVAEQVSGPLNFLLLGSDARDQAPANGQRSDTIVLVHVPATMDRAYLISIPRDLMVDIPADPDVHFRGSREKINAAFNYGGGGDGGYQLLSKTLNQLTGVKFDGAAIINFDGFQSAVGLLGGVNMCVDERTVSIHTGAVYEPGCQHLAPWQALDYVRQRETLPNGDYDRQRHQQQFLKAIFSTAMQQGVTSDPIKLDRLIRALGNSLTVDTNGTSLADLIFSLRDVLPSAVVGIRVPSYPAMISGTSYVLPYDAADTLYQAVTSDTLDAWVAANSSWVNPT